MAVRLGVSGWRWWRGCLQDSGLDSPEVDMLWPEYLYPKGLLEELGGMGGGCNLCWKVEKNDKIPLHIDPH
jgi:hypothetical protein